MENLFEKECYPLFIFNKHFCVVKEINTQYCFNLNNIKTPTKIAIIFINGHDEKINFEDFVKSSINTKELVYIKDGKIKFTGKQIQFDW